MAVGSPYKTQWGWAEEATFGTAIADDQAFTFFEGPPPNVTYTYTDDKTLKYRGYQIADKNDSFTSTAGGMVEIAFSDLILRQDQAAVLCYSVMQNMSEAAATPYQKDLAWGSAFAAPDFSTNAGLFLTIGIKDTVSNNHRKFTSCVLRDLVLSADLTGDGRFRASGTFMSGFVPNNAAQFTGTWSASTQQYFNWSAPTTKTIAGSNILMSQISFTFNNGIVRVGNTSAGNAENYAMASELMCEISFTALYDSVTDGLIVDMLAGTARALVFEIGSTGVDQAFLFTATNCEFTSNEQDYANAAGRMTTVAAKAMLNTTSNDAVNIEICDAVDRAW